MYSSPSREQILKNVRNALLNKKENPYPDFSETPLYNPLDEIAEVVFAQEFQKINGKFIYCESELMFMEHLITMSEDRDLQGGWRKVHCFEKELGDLLSLYQFPYLNSDDKLSDSEVGITTCDALIARNGSILLTSGTESGRRLSIYPHCHIVVAYTTQVVMDLHEAFTVVKEKYAKMPSMVSVVTGPSRTADIEKTLVLGAHGPKELIVFLIDDIRELHQ
jgi:L-lactate dehydrogenase complex protein LldG